jgi:dinuclear metal center YbgI/SA1388 family protein
MPKIKDIVRHLERLAPIAYQESYDNCGLLTGDAETETDNILLTLEVTEAVIDEALQKGCNLIVSHHPLIFRPLRKITGAHWTERCLLKAIRRDIALYAAHTNLDNIAAGVNRMIARRLDLQNVRTLSTRTGTLAKLTTFVPAESLSAVLEALHDAGAGHIGNYERCSFRVQGTGTFRPGDRAQPYLGKAGETEEVREERVEVIFPSHLKSPVLAALFRAHPYEEVAYYLHDLANEDPLTGAGAIGELPDALDFNTFIGKLKERFGSRVVRHTAFGGSAVHRIAICGGAGSFLIPNAAAAGADVFVSADLKYHDFFEGGPQMALVDIGHYESEQWTKELLMELLTEKFPNIALRLSEVVTNPIIYT